MTSEGAVEDLEVIGADLPFNLKNTVMRTLRYSHYRPRFVNGRPVATKGLRFREIYTENGTPFATIMDSSQMNTRSGSIYR